MALSKTTLLTFVKILLTKIILVKSYSRGPPESVCDSMLPGHVGVQAQTSPVPFQLAPEEQRIEAGQTLNIVLKQGSGTGSEQFKGFLVQAYQSGTNTRYGNFDFSEISST